MTTDTDPRTFNGQLADILSARRDELGMSLRQIEEKSGVNYMTVKRILENSRNMRMDDFEAIATALGISPWGAVKQAEDSLRDRAVLSDPATYVAQAEAKLRHLAQHDYAAAAKEHTPDKLADLGEENQESDK